MNQNAALARRRSRRQSDVEREEIVQDRIFDAALGIVRRAGFAELTCANLADLLHIRTYSLIKLIDGIERVQDKVAVQAVKELTEVTASAARGRTERDAIEALVDAQRLFAQAQPGMYAASQSALSRISLDAFSAIEALAKIERDVMKTYGAPPRRCDQLAWCMRASVRGAISLESSDKLTRSDEVDQHFDQLIELLDAGAKLAAAPRMRRYSSVA